MCAFTTRAAGTADDKTATVRIVADGSVTFDGEAVTIEALRAKLASFRAGLPAGEVADAYVELSGVYSAPMAAVHEVKEVLRRVPLLRIRYRCGESAATRMLPPVPSADGPVQVVAFAAKEQNCLSVLVSEGGSVTVSGAGASHVVSLTELAESVAGFVAGKVGHAECEIRSFGLPDGRSVDYSASRGVVCLIPSPQAPYGKYVSVQQAITAGFETVRDALAREWFGRGIAALTEAERQAVRQAVPVAVFDRD